MVMGFSDLTAGDWVLLIAEHYHGVLPSCLFMEARGWVLQEALSIKLDCTWHTDDDCDPACGINHGIAYSPALRDGLRRQVAMGFFDESSARGDFRLTEDGRAVLAWLHTEYPQQCERIDVVLGGGL